MTRLRARGQITLPDTIRKQARLSAGDLLEADLTEEGILLRPRKLIDPGQAWFWTSGWQAKEREADQDLEAGRMETFRSGDALVRGLKKLTPRTHSKGNSA